MGNVLNDFFTPEELNKLNSLPALPKELEERMRVVANMMIDRVFENKENGIVNLPEKRSN